ncbi:MAG TPA: hypothetical protein VLM40_17980 [Gemmata sp.]|nr:hypothetical protein [Gemmata sp.]
MQQTIDVTDLPESVVNDLRQLVSTLRNRLHATDIAKPRAESPAEWSARLTAWVAQHPKRSLTIDDSREAVYGGLGE